jgi:hypothetical protein
MTLRRLETPDRKRVTAPLARPDSQTPESGAARREARSFSARPDARSPACA